MSNQMTLPEPFDLPEPARVAVDVSIEPWEARGHVPPSLDDPGRVPMTVPRAVADHVMRAKNIAGQMVKQEFAYGHVLADLTKATSQPRADITRMDADFAAAKQAGATPAQLEAISALQLAARKETQVQLRDAIQQVVQPVREQLAKAEQAAMQELEERPGTAPTAADYSAASELADTLKLVPAPFAAKMLMQRLVIEPVKTGKVGLTVAVLPLLRAQMADPAYESSYEFRDVLELCQIVTRDVAYHAAHQRLRTAGALRHKLDGLTADAGALHGTTTAARNMWYREFGATPAKVQE
jgi:hypothetical protein